jgi:hypothetical protein
MFGVSQYVSALALGALLAFPALAQVPFLAGGATVSLAATGTTSRVQVQAGPYAKAIRLYNSGTVAVFVVCGDVAAVATVAGIPVAPGSVEVLGCAQTYVAGITGGTAATLYITPGDGL